MKQEKLPKTTFPVKKESPNIKCEFWGDNIETLTALAKGTVYKQEVPSIHPSEQQSNRHHQNGGTAVV